MRRSYNSSNDGRKTTIHIPVVKIGSHLGLTEQRSNNLPIYSGTTVIHGLPPTTQVQLLKSRQLQPLPLKNGNNKRPGSKKLNTRSRGASQVFASAEHLDSHRVGNERKSNLVLQPEDDSIANLNNYSTQIGSRFSASQAYNNATDVTA